MGAKTAEVPTELPELGTAFASRFPEITHAVQARAALGKFIIGIWCTQHTPLHTNWKPETDNNRTCFSRDLFLWRACFCTWVVTLCDFDIWTQGKNVERGTPSQGAVQFCKFLPKSPPVNDHEVFMRETEICKTVRWFPVAFLVYRLHSFLHELKQSAVYSPLSACSNFIKTSIVFHTESL